MGPGRFHHELQQVQLQGWLAEWRRGVSQSLSLITSASNSFPRPIFSFHTTLTQKKTDWLPYRRLTSIAPGRAHHAAPRRKCWPRCSSPQKYLTTATTNRLVCFVTTGMSMGEHTLTDEMPPREGFILPETLVLTGLRFHRRCH